MLIWLLWSVTIIACILCIVYTGMIAAFYYGWLNTKQIKSHSGGTTKVAVIVAVRNEEKTIAVCLDSLFAQSYPTEIIVVDDYSSDRTSEIIKELSVKHTNLKLISLEGTPLKGKKSAIAEAIKNTTAELIVTTDADCRMGAEWLESIVAFYEHTGAQMIAGPVAFEKEDTAFKKMQSLEMIALMGSTAGSLYFDWPVLCNGANLAYTKKAFNEVNGFSEIDKQASGDDVLLMYKVGKEHPGKVHFLKNSAAIVYTSAKENLPEFINQRKRWASKGAATMDTATKFVSMTVYFFSLFLVLIGVLSGLAAIKSRICLPFFEICLILTGIKCVIDFLLLFLAASFFGKRKHLYLFIPEQFLYLLYVVVVGMLGSKGKFEWKGRNYN